MTPRLHIQWHDFPAAPSVVAWLSICLFLFLSPVQPVASQSPAKQVVLHFPPERSLGKLYRLKIINPADPKADDVPFAEARGNLTVPANSKLRLNLSYEGATDLKALADCAKQGIIYSISACYLESMNDQDLEEIAKIKSVQELVLTDGDITDKGAQSIAAMTQLLHLDICQTMLTARGYNSLRSLTALQRLNSDSVPLQGADLACLVPMSHLQILNIGRTALTDNALKNLGRVTSLTSLKLCKNQNITDKGVSFLANLKNLQRLDLRETSVTRKCLPWL